MREKKINVAKQVPLALAIALIIFCLKESIEISLNHFQGTIYQDVVTISYLLGLTALCFKTLFLVGHMGRTKVTPDPIETTSNDNDIMYR